MSQKQIPCTTIQGKCVSSHVRMGVEESTGEPWHVLQFCGPAAISKCTAEHKCVGSMLTVSESDIVTSQWAQTVNLMEAQ